MANGQNQRSGTMLSTWEVGEAPAAMMVLRPCWPEKLHCFFKGKAATVVSVVSEKKKKKEI